MDKEQFKAIAQDLKLAYSSDKFLADKDTFELWYRHLEDKDEKYVRKSVNAYINHSHYPPHIADIRKGCQFYEDKDRKYVLEMWQKYESASSLYPTHGNKEEEKDLFSEKLKAYPSEKWMDIAIKFHDGVSEFVRKNEIRGTFPPFKDYIDEQVR